MFLFTKTGIYSQTMMVSYTLVRQENITKLIHLTLSVVLQEHTDMYSGDNTYHDVV